MTAPLSLIRIPRLPGPPGGPKGWLIILICSIWGCAYAGLMLAAAHATGGPPDTPEEGLIRGVVAGILALGAATMLRDQLRKRWRS